MNENEIIKPLERMPVPEAAKLLGIRPQALRCGLQQGIFSFGFAIKQKQWVYVIYREKLMKYLDPEFPCNNSEVK